jgi:hypothetical protein
VIVTARHVLATDVRAAMVGRMTYTITTTDGAVFECDEVRHQVDGSVSIESGGRKLRLAAHYWQVIEGDLGEDGQVP